MFRVSLCEILPCVTSALISGRLCWYWLGCLLFQFFSFVLYLINFFDLAICPFFLSIPSVKSKAKFIGKPSANVHLGTKPWRAVTVGEAPHEAGQSASATLHSSTQEEVSCLVLEVLLLPEMSRPGLQQLSV